VETTHESIYITEIVTDVDESLKIKRIEEFTDSKLQAELLQAQAAAKSNA
jgi:hypothetical protein